VGKREIERAKSFQKISEQSEQCAAYLAGLNAEKWICREGGMTMRAIENINDRHAINYGEWMLEERNNVLLPYYAAILSRDRE